MVVGRHPFQIADVSPGYVGIDHVT